jgi:NitT/TauT family transport system substrate-binding protein
MAGTSGGLLQWFPVYVARGMKFFEEEGIDLDWVDLNSGSAMVAAVIGGSCEMAPMGMEHMVLSQKEGGDLMVFAALFDIYPHGLVLTPSAMAKNGITISQSVDEKIHRLRGLTIGIAGPGGSTDVMLRNMLRLRKMDPDSDIRIQPLGQPPAMLAALSKGLVDGVLQSAPVDMVAEAKGYGTIIVDPFKDDIPELHDVPFSGMLARRAYIEQNPDVILAATRAVTKAIRFAEEHPRETLDAVRPFVAGDDPALIDRMIERYRGGQAKTPVVTRSQFEGTLRWVDLSESKPLSVRMEQVVYNKAALQAEKEILQKS